MFFIWLHLLDIAHIVRGHFTTVEIVLSIIMGICSLLGIFTSLKVMPAKNISTSIFLTTSAILLSLVFMYIWQIGNILNNYHQPWEITTGVGVSIILLVSLVISLRNTTSPNPFYNGLVIYAFLLFQVIAMWISFHQSFAHD